MTEKDFKLIAEAIRNYSGNEAVRRLALEMSNKSKSVNPKFNQQTFLKACNVEIDVTLY